RPQRLLDDLFGSVSEIDKTAFDIVAKPGDAIDLAIEIGADHVRREARHGAEIGEGRVDPDRQNRLLPAMLGHQSPRAFSYHAAAAALTSPRIWSRSSSSRPKSG